MLKAYDTLLQTPVTASIATTNSDNEAFRYECLCCGEEVFLAAQDSVYKATHFRHRSGNNDKECELYLGQYGMVPSSSAIRNKKQDRVEFYYQNTFKAFFISLRFSDAEIKAYEAMNVSVEVRAYRNQHPFFTQQITRANFFDDIPEKFMLETYASPYYISNTLNNIKREYNLFWDTGPTFFKIQGEEENFSAKYIKSRSLYTNVKYFIAWPGRNTAQIRLNKVPNVIIDNMLEFKTMNNCTVWALVATFTGKNPQLDSLLQSWGYNLSTSEELSLLWPPAYECDETLHISSNVAYVFSSFALQAFGNTNTTAGSLHKIDNYTTRINIKDKLRILKKNAEISVVPTLFQLKESSLEIQHIWVKKFIVPNDGVFYRFSSCGVEKLVSGQRVFLTDSSYIAEYYGNYICKIISMPTPQVLPFAERIREARAYYKLSIPYNDAIETFRTEDTEEYINESKKTGYINKAVEALIREEKHE